MKKFFFLIIIFLSIFNVRLFSSNQLADPVHTGNVHFQYNISYAGYFSEADKLVADSLEENKGFWGFSFNYGLAPLLDLTLGYQNSSAGFGLKYSPDFKMPVRLALEGDLYTNVSNVLVYPIVSGILSYHINKNITFTGGLSTYFHFEEKIKNEIFFTLDIERGDLFKHKVPDFFVNIFIPKSFQIDVTYPFSDVAKKLYIGFSIRHEFELNIKEESI
ncbi:MAG: hypothetical protein WHT27_00890 [candidate division WOR-3 bacterium]|jgi:hypothetical protein